MKTESIQSLTSLFQSMTPSILGIIGFGVFGITIVFSNRISDVRWAGALGLAGTAITGAAGLAQPRATVSIQSEQNK